jgi:hypothetical protein
MRRTGRLACAGLTVRVGCSGLAVCLRDWLEVRRLSADDGLCGSIVDADDTRFIRVSGGSDGNSRDKADSQSAATGEIESTHGVVPGSYGVSPESIRKASSGLFG